MELQTIKIIEAYLIYGMSCSDIEKAILGIDSPARGGGFKAKKILNDLGITVNEKSALKDIGIDDAINNASGEYLITLLEYKEYRKTAKDILPIPIVKTSGTESIKQRKSAYDFKKENYDKETSQHRTIKTTSSYTEETLYKLVQNAEQYETQIYKNCRNYRKEPIFERVPETKEIWNDIKTFVTSRDDFGKFIRALYMLIFETTKDEDPKNKFENGKPKPIYRLPKEFVRLNTETKRFMDIVDILRHTFGEAHTPSKLKIPEWKVSYPDALEQLLGSRFEPQSYKEFQKLQIEILKRFENAMKILLEIVKNELTAPVTL
jgi:hypothetical protein